MEKELLRLVARDTPEINPLLANGIAVEHLRHPEKYLDQVFRVAARSFPPNLVYEGGRRCTPLEEYREVTKRRSGNKRTFDVARSDIVMMRYTFRFNGEELPPRYLYIPFVSDAGCIMISGSRFNISPVLADRVISIGVSNIFVRLLRARLTFERSSSHFMIDGRRETVHVVWSTIYNSSAKNNKIRPTVKANCTLMHYLLCKYGFHDTFQKFGNCQPIVGGPEINRHTYPEDEWFICTSTQVKPKGCGKGYYEPTDLRVAVRKEELTPMIKNMIGGFFYVVDHFPSMMRPDYFHTVHETRQWKILMGHILFSGSINVGKLHDDISDHMGSLDEYLDTLTELKLRDIGIQVADIYQLFALIIEKFNDWLLGASEKVSSMYDKELSVVPYVLFEMTSAVIKFGYKIVAASKKDLTQKEVLNAMNMFLKPGLIFNITKNHGEVSTISYSGDNKAMKITSLLIPQSGSSKQSNRKSRVVLDDPAKLLHVSVAEVGGYSAIPKSAPDGRGRINPHVQVDAKGVVLRNPEHMALLDRCQEAIRRV